MGRTLACSDLHGQYNLYKQIKNFLKEDDKVYFLGDATDRGPQPWSLFKTILNDPQWIYIKGNHEDMLADAIAEYYENDERTDIYCQHLFDNGGIDTFSNWLADGAYKKWVNIIDELSYVEVYHNQKNQSVILCHAGFTPTSANETEVSCNNLIWDREHITDPWSDNESLKDAIVVHGHTPVPYLYKELNLPADTPLKCLWYSLDKYSICHKCDIDLGCYATKKTCLLDLDTFEEHYFTY